MQIFNKMMISLTRSIFCSHLPFNYDVYSDVQWATMVHNKFGQWYCRMHANSSRFVCQNFALDLICSALTFKLEVLRISKRRLVTVWRLKLSGSNTHSSFGMSFQNICNIDSVSSKPCGSICEFHETQLIHETRTSWILSSTSKRWNAFCFYRMTLANDSLCRCSCGQVPTRFHRKTFENFNF